MSIYYRRIKSINAPREFLGRTIYVSNHANSFMDPLVVASFRLPIVFFMVRADIYKGVMKSIFWASHMFPIYRQQDGGDTKALNDGVFAKCTRVLKYGRNLLIFGEGFTDDVFVRRLKPIKKGAVRIGFATLESMNWKKKIYIAAVGCNYSAPSKMRSDLLISGSDKICLNDYREAYEENPNKVITELTKKIEVLMQDQITHIEDKQFGPLHENIMSVTRKGIHGKSYDEKLSLVKRWKYSQKLAKWINGHEGDNAKPLIDLSDKLKSYFERLEKLNLEDHLVYWKLKNSSGSRIKEIMYCILLFPFMLIGFIHCSIPYIITKRFVEKSFKREVFHGSVKMMMGKILTGLFNIPVIFLIYYLVYPSWWVSIAYYFTIGLTGLAAYMWFKHLAAFKNKGIMNKSNLDEIIAERNSLEKLIDELLPEFTTSHESK